MRVYEGNGIGDMYFQLIRDLTNSGRGIVVRGHECIESKEPVTLVYRNPGACWMCIPGRKFNPFFALAEVVWILSGRGDVDWICYFNENMRMFQDGDNPQFHGAYGTRIFKWSNLGSQPTRETFLHIDQLSYALFKLRKDSFTRQAVISIWDPVLDNLMVSKDYPCNNLVYFSLRDGVLDMTVVIRSNDLVWGVPYNAVQFTHLLAYTAGNLQVKMGTLTYVIQNLHYYMHLYTQTLATLLEAAFSGGQIISEKIPGFDVVDHRTFVHTKTGVDYILDRKLCWPAPAETSFHYWTGTIPFVLWIYRAIKEQKIWDVGQIDFIAERISGFGDPLKAMILDFYQGSKNQTAKEVVFACRSTLAREE